jgi:hypothetical protein
MAIQSINSGANPAASIQKSRADESGHVADQVGIPEHAQASQKARDAVEVAHSRGTAAEEPQELAAARTALSHAETLSEERRAEILDRIKSGFYNRADVLEEVSGKMADALKSGKGPKS